MIAKVRRGAGEDISALSQSAAQDATVATPTPRFIGGGALHWQPNITASRMPEKCKENLHFCARCEMPVRLDNCFHSLNFRVPLLARNVHGVTQQAIACAW